MINISADLLISQKHALEGSIEASHKRVPSLPPTPPCAREATKQTHKMFVLWLLVHAIRRCASRMHSALSSCTLPFTPDLPRSLACALALTHTLSRPLHEKPRNEHIVCSFRGFACMLERRHSPMHTPSILDGCCRHGA